MTRLDIMAKALSEATGTPEAGVREMISAFNFSHPSPRLFEEVPDDAAAEMLENLRGQKDGIIDWLRQGAMKAVADPTEVNRIQDNWKRRN
jgi:hypothetical protein